MKSTHNKKDIDDKTKTLPSEDECNKALRFLEESAMEIVEDNDYNNEGKVRYEHCDKAELEEAISPLQKVIQEYFNIQSVLEGMNSEQVKDMKNEYESLKSYKKLTDFGNAVEKFYVNDTYFAHIVKAISSCEDKEQKTEAIHCLAYLKDQINIASTPLFFECIKPDNWIWDKKKERWIKVLEKVVVGETEESEFYQDTFKNGVRLLKLGYNPFAWELTVFEENRFYDKQIKEKTKIVKENKQ